MARPDLACALASLLVSAGGTTPANALSAVGPPIGARGRPRRGPRREPPKSNTRAVHREPRAPPSSLRGSVVDEIDSFYQAFPYASAFLTCGIKAGAADIVAQRKEATAGRDPPDGDALPLPWRTAAVDDDGPRRAIDARRNVAFVLYGGLYQGIAQFVIFNRIFPLVFGDGTDVATVASKVLFDNAFVSPFLCLPVAYLVKGAVYQFTLEEASSRYVRDLRDGLLVKYWCFWIPAQSLTFGVVPPHLRIAFIAAVSFFWLVVFSSISSRAYDAETTC